MKRLFILYSLLSIALFAVADEISFEWKGRSKVVQGSQFQLEYVVTGTDGGSVTLPQFKGCTELFKGTSRGTSVSIINGNVSRTVSSSITVTLRADEEGTHEIEPATLTVDGKTYKTKPLTLIVLKADDAGNNNSGGGESRSGGRSAVVSSGNSTETFTRLVLSRTNVYEQEAILATLKVYTLAPQLNFTKVTLPTFEGFAAQELDVPASNQWDIERYNDRNYKTATLRRILLFPQQSGEIKINGGSSEIDVYEVQGVNFFGQPYYDVISKNIITPSVNVNVKSLPQDKPLNFTGGVGDFTLTGELSTTELKANEALTLKLIISGKGNLQLMQNPNVEFPSEFEAYDPQVNLDIRSGAGGVSGKRVIEYTIIPRYAGTFTIPSIEIAYFDPQAKAYKTMASPEFTVEVSKGDDVEAATVSNFSSQDDVRLLNADIRHIVSSSGHLTHLRNAYVDSWSYWLWFILPILLVVIYAIASRIYATTHADVALNRNRKANRVALRRLKQAGIFLKARNEAQFYEEVLRAVWGYLCDKLTMPISELSRDNVQAELSRSGVNDELVMRFIRILDQCEFARYAPSQAGNAMEQLYQETIEAIGEMESVVKSKKK
ncbi:MAG: protein BatD [Bacteroidaceae bacterium]|nr:protein BatD [Bacteroidaceae bacterium]